MTLFILSHLFHPYLLLVRFAKIKYLILDQGKAHVQWFEHAKQSFLEELGHEQELFTVDVCDHILFEHIIAKVQVHEMPSGPIQLDDYFYKCVYICCSKT